MFCGPLGYSAECFVFPIYNEVFRQRKIVQQPGNNHLIKDHAIHITTAAHLDSAMCQQVYLSLDVFSNRNIKCAASEIIDQENTFRMCAAHDTHHRSNGLLHERHLADTRHSGGLHSGILLHLIERGRHCNHSCCFRIVPDFLREISI